MIKFAVATLFACLICGSFASEIKNCPQSGATLLDETYPVQAFVISIAPQSYSDFDDEQRIGETRALQAPTNFIIEVARAYESASASPKIIVPTNIIYFKELKAYLEGRVPRKFLDNVQRVDGLDYTWQQDYFESFFDPKTGAPVLRPIASYKRNRASESTRHIANLLGKRAMGKTLKSYYSNGQQEDELAYGEEGGNIEALPGGLCLTGSNLSPKFTSQFCGDSDNNIQVEVGWLEVGHVDEVFKVLPTQYDGAPKECQFSIMAASPAKALELLSSPKARKRRFFSSYDGYENETIALNLEFFQNKTEGDPGDALCELSRSFFSFAPFYPLPDREAASIMKSDYESFLYLFGAQAPGASEEEELMSCVERLRELKNHDFVEKFKRDSGLVEFNLAIQKSIEKSKEKIKTAVLTRLPQCQKTFEFIDAPDIFYGDDLDGEILIENGGFGQSFFPNPTNAVVANKTVIISDPSNHEFRDYLVRELKGRGLKVVFIDTWEYAHIGKGNLHCATHAIRHCKASP